eukprot:1158903-Pelagomonas_calceolata.AAC.5
MHYTSDCDEAPGARSAFIETKQEIQLCLFIKCSWRRGQKGTERTGRSVAQTHTHTHTKQDKSDRWLEGPHSHIKQITDLTLCLIWLEQRLGPATPNFVPKEPHIT